MSEASGELNSAPQGKDQLGNGNRAEKPVKSRLGKIAPAIKKVAGKAILGTPLAGLLISSGAIDNPNVIAPNLKEPTPAVAPLPDFKSQSTDTLQPYTPPLNTEIPSTLTPTPEPTPIPTQEVVSDSSKSPKQEQAERKELIPYSPSITIIDAAPSVPTEGIIQKEFISNDEMIRNMLGDKYVSKEKIIQEFGENYEEKWDEIVSKYPQTLTYRLVDQYFNHGEKVARVVENTLERSEFKSTGVNVTPLQKAFDQDSIKFIKEASGNPGVSLNFDPKRIIELLKDDPSRVINGSFQVGNVELFQETKVKTEVIPKYDLSDPRFSGEGLPSELDGKEVLYQGAVGIRTEAGRVVYYDKEGQEITPISYEELEKRKLENSEIIEHKSTELVINGAYAKEKAIENLPKLFEVCNAYPDKFFVFAGGNTGEDFRETMEALKDQVPKNLLIAAEWIKYDYGFGVYEGPSMEYGKYGQVLGPDMYVYNERSGNPSGSSFSVPELSAEIDTLLSKGLSFKQAKEAVLAKSNLHTLSLNDGTHPTVRVFNPSNIQGK